MLNSNLLNNITGLLTKKSVTQIINKAIQSQIDINNAVITLDNEAIGDLKFDIIDSNMINFQSETSDNYIDTNRPIQDHIVKKPIEITLKGKIGRYVNKVKENKSHSPFYYRTMNLVSSYIPNISNLSIDLARKGRQTISNLGGEGILNSLLNSGISFAYGYGLNLLNDAWHTAIEKYGLSPAFILKNKQRLTNSLINKETTAFESFYILWKMSQEVTVKTYWWSFDNMVITNLRPIKEEGDITEFTITLKQLNKVSSIVTKNITQSKSPVKEQKSETVNNGKTSGQFTILDIDVPNITLPT